MSRWGTLRPIDLAHISARERRRGASRTSVPRGRARNNTVFSHDAGERPDFRVPVGRRGSQSWSGRGFLPDAQRCRGHIRVAGGALVDSSVGTLLPTWSGAFDGAAPPRCPAHIALLV